MSLATVSSVGSSVNLPLKRLTELGSSAGTVFICGRNCIRMSDPSYLSSATFFYIILL